MIKYTLLIALLCNINFAIASNNDGVEQLVKPILSAIENGKTESIISMAYPKESESRKYISDADISRMNKGFATAISSLGTLHGVTMFHESDIPGTYVVRYYVMKFTRQPAILKFEFYKPSKVWRIHNMEFDNNLDDYFTKAAERRLGALGFIDIRNKIKSNK